MALSIVLYFVYNIISSIRHADNIFIIVFKNIAKEGSPIIFLRIFQNRFI